MRDLTCPQYGSTVQPVVSCAVASTSARTTSPVGAADAYRRAIGIGRLAGTLLKPE